MSPLLGMSKHGCLAGQYIFSLDFPSCNTHNILLVLTSSNKNAIALKTVVMSLVALLALATSTVQKHQLMTVQQVCAVQLKTTSSTLAENVLELFVK